MASSCKRSALLPTPLLLIVLSSYIVNCVPIFSNSQSSLDDDSDDRFVVNMTYIDINNPDTHMLRQLERHNVTLSSLRNLQSALRAPNRNFPTEPTSTSSTRSNEAIAPRDQRKRYEEMAIESIKDVIAMNTYDTPVYASRPVHPINSLPTHDVSAYPICDLPKNMNETFWSGGNSWNLHFNIPTLNGGPMYLYNAVLRLFKINPANSEQLSLPRTASADCSNQSEELIRITTSVYYRRSKKSEIKKKMCSTNMIPKSVVGWIEFDIKTAIKLWEKTSRNLGIAIDIQDQDENSLKASQYFQAHNCEAATPAIPWSYYRDQLRWPTSAMDRVPHSPRVDTRVIDYRNIYPHSGTPICNHFQMNSPAAAAPSSPSAPFESSTTATITEDHLRQHYSNVDSVTEHNPHRPHHRRRHVHRHNHGHHFHSLNNNPISSSPIGNQESVEFS